MVNDLNPPVEVPKTEEDQPTVDTPVSLIGGIFVGGDPNIFNHKENHKKNHGY